MPFARSDSLTPEVRELLGQDESHLAAADKVHIGGNASLCGEACVYCRESDSDGEGR